ncbi:Thiol-disulfide oxidoreductase DCC [Planctomycetales bacterium 10988]|nr:Thiol-disulfide oxidoreductase DCC [Planctomycetales bacterium 10988]
MSGEVKEKENVPESRSQAPSTEGPILLFDGVCNLCHASVHFILDRDPGKKFHFASLQSEVGKQLLEKHGLPTEDWDSVVLIEGDRASQRSTAALRAAKLLKWPWPLLAVFLIIPRMIRDPVYQWIARNRYRWFGKEESCRIPTPELRERFLDSSSPSQQES